MFGAVSPTPTLSLGKWGPASLRDRPHPIGLTTSFRSRFISSDSADLLVGRLFDFAGDGKHTELGKKAIEAPMPEPIGQFARQT